MSWEQMAGKAFHPPEPFAQHHRAQFIVPSLLPSQGFLNLLVTKA